MGDHKALELAAGLAEFELFTQDESFKLFLQQAAEFVYILLFPLDNDLDVAVSHILDPTAKPALLGKGPGRIPEPDTLDRTSKDNMGLFQRRHSPDKAYG
jgi:hypothetical protein